MHSKFVLAKWITLLLKSCNPEIGCKMADGQLLRISSFVYVHVCMCACVFVHHYLLKRNKAVLTIKISATFQPLYMAPAINIMNGSGLTNKECHEDVPLQGDKVMLYYHDLRLKASWVPSIHGN